jgi:AcrR family transcriptional regulator
MTKSAKKAAQKPRRTPAQSRSAETVAVILEAAARVLELRGLDGFNTNSVAERAGVSIGSLYQYFRNKDALLASLIELQGEPFVRMLETLPADESFQTALLRLIEASVHQQLLRPELSSCSTSLNGRQRGSGQPYD